MGWGEFHGAGGGVLGCSIDSSTSTASGGGTTYLSLHVPSERDRGSVDFNGLDFKLVMDNKSGPPSAITLVAASLQEKAAWCSDISQVRGLKQQYSNSDLLFIAVYSGSFVYMLVVHE